MQTLISAFYSVMAQFTNGATVATSCVLMHGDVSRFIKICSTASSCESTCPCSCGRVNIVFVTAVMDMLTKHGAFISQDIHCLSRAFQGLTVRPLRGAGSFHAKI